MADAVRAGARAFQALFDQVGEVSEATCLQASDDVDSRDYVAISTLVRGSIESNLNHHDPAHREGYLRALTSMVCLLADGCAPGKDWDPIRETEAAFSAPGIAANVLRKAAR